MTRQHILLFSILLLSACHSKEISSNSPMVASPPDIPAPLARPLPQGDSAIPDTSATETTTASTESSTFNNPNYQSTSLQRANPKEAPVSIPKPTFFNTTSTSPSASPVFTTIPAPKGYPMLPTASVKLPNASPPAQDKPSTVNTPPAKRVRLMFEENEAIKRESESIETELKSGELEEPESP